MGQKTHPIQLRAQKPIHTCWHTRAQYANLLHYNTRLQQGLPKLLHQAGFQGPGYTAWTGKGFFLVQTCLPIQGREGRDISFGTRFPFLLPAQKSQLKNEKTLDTSVSRGAYALQSAFAPTGAKAPQTRSSDIVDQSTIDHLAALLHTREHSLSNPKIKSTIAPTDVTTPSGAKALQEQHNWLLVLSHARTQGWWNQGVHVCTLETAYQNAQTLADLLRYKMEHNGKARQVSDEAIQHAQSTWWIQGMKIRIAGRLQGAEIASAHTKQWGILGLHTLSQRIDFAYVKAYTSVGIIGIQVWLSIRAQKGSNT